jgi:glycosyltransferase involved in cell wall biosynthesis
MVERTLVVPCHNEASRLDVEAFTNLGRQLEGRVLFVDDGSTDATADILDAARRRCGQVVDVLTLPRNRGKAEAVRAGLLAAVRDGTRLVGYFDADLATPPAEIARLFAYADSRPDLVAVLGSRVRLLGTSIDRHEWRHLLGRLWATGASAALDLPVYDTQCGAKVFQVGPELSTAIVEPFKTSWAFDVELLARLCRGGVHASALAEVPLNEWRDVAGSKLRALPALRAAWDLLRIAHLARLSGSPTGRDSGSLNSA